MTANPPSRTTLADLIPLIEQANLSPIQKRDQISAVKTIARLLGATPGEIDADPARLRRRLETIAPQALGLSEGRWNNIRSLLGKALALARPMMPGRQNGSVAARMGSASRAALPEPRSQSVGLGAPSQCDWHSIRRRLRSQILRPITQAILNDRLRAKPEQTWDAIVWTWNACRREIAGWPDIEIPREIRREIYVAAVVGLSTVPEGRRRCLPPSPVGRRPERGRPAASCSGGDLEDQGKAVARRRVGACP